MQFTLDQFTVNKDFPFYIQYGKHDRGLPVHSHKDFSELVIVLSGNATHIVNDETFSISKGDVFVISPETTHGFLDATQFRICNIMFRHNLFAWLNADIKKSIGFQALFVVEPYFSKTHKFSSHLSLLPSDFLTIDELIATMIKEYNQALIGRKTALSTMFLYFVTLLCRLYEKDIVPAKEEEVLRLAAASSYIQQHFTEQISISYLAKLSNYSERHFSRLFYEIYGNTPLDYILSLRLELACELLKTTKKSHTISSIAFTCGFPNSNYFSRIFKKRFGMTPTDYRSGSKNYETL